MANSPFTPQAIYDRLDSFEKSLRPVNQSGVYAIINSINRKIYIGSAATLNTRFNRHLFDLKNGKHHSRHLQRSYRKHPEAFEFFVIELVQDQKRLLEREQFWIDFYQSINPNSGYNISPRAGSCLGVKHSKESRLNMSIASKGKKKSPEIRERMKEWTKGHKGRTFTEEQRRIQSETRKGKNFSTPEGIASMLSKRSISKWGYIPVVQMSLDGAEIRSFESMAEAGRVLGIHPENIKRSILRLYGCKQCGGFRWKYA
jgi:group I intron endonuclease